MNTSSNIQRRYLTEREACRYVRCSRFTLYRLRKKGLLPYSYLGNSIRYKIDDLDAYMEANRVDY